MNADVILQVAAARGLTVRVTEHGGIAVDGPPEGKTQTLMNAVGLHLRELVGLVEAGRMAELQPRDPDDGAFDREAETLVRTCYGRNLGFRWVAGRMSLWGDARRVDDELRRRLEPMRQRLTAHLFPPIGTGHAFVKYLMPSGTILRTTTDGYPYAETFQPAALGWGFFHDPDWPAERPELWRAPWGRWESPGERGGRWSFTPYGVSP